MMKAKDGFQFMISISKKLIESFDAIAEMFNDDIG
jgi:flagellar hook-basal body complex protein FliE